jgi:hypothetical protein
MQLRSSPRTSAPDSSRCRSEPSRRLRARSTQTLTAAGVRKLTRDTGTARRRTADALNRRCTRSVRRARRFCAAESLNASALERAATRLARDSSDRSFLTSAADGALAVTCEASRLSTLAPHPATAKPSTTATAITPTELICVRNIVDRTKVAETYNTPIRLVKKSVRQNPERLSRRCTRVRRPRRSDRRVPLMTASSS